MISTAPGSDLTEAIARSWQILRKAPLAIDDPEAKHLSAALEDLRALHDALDRHDPDHTVEAAMRDVSTSQTGLWTVCESDELRKALRRIQEEIRNAGSDLLDW